MSRRALKAWDSPSTLAGADAPPRPPLDPSRCTFLGCPDRPTRQLEQSIGGRPWFGCDAHWPAMEKSLAIGLPGASSGTASVIVTKVNLVGIVR